MTFGRFLGALAGMLLAAAVLVWILVSLAALVYALTKGDGQAARIYALFAGVGLAVAALSWWGGSRVAKSRAARR